MERNFAGLGSAQFRVKYKEAALQSGPSGIAGYLGTLHKGAVVEVLADDHPYYYRVRLDNGLEGYVYKAAGELSSGLSGSLLSRSETPVPSVEAPASPSTQVAPLTPSVNGDYSAGESVRPAPRIGSSSVRPRMPAARSASVPPPARSSNGTGSQAARRGGQAVVITTSEIAVFDKPGIVGRQVGKLRRGEQVTLVGQDSFFFEVMLTNGLAGFIPRYAGELI